MLYQSMKENKDLADVVIAAAAKHSKKKALKVLDKMEKYLKENIKDKE